ncbi:MAG: hypothetical protein LBP76_04265, partial [Treponema sp.]|nr:hypothetical protein [Treponema sp.]
MKASKRILSAALVLLAATGTVFAGGGKEKIPPVSYSPSGESKILTVQTDVNISTVNYQGTQEGNALNVMRTLGEGLYYLD